MVKFRAPSAGELPELKGFGATLLLPAWVPRDICGSLFLQTDHRAWRQLACMLRHENEQTPRVSWHGTSSVLACAHAVIKLLQSTLGDCALRNASLLVRVAVLCALLTWSQPQLEEYCNKHGYVHIYTYIDRVHVDRFLQSHAICTLLSCMVWSHSGQR